MFKVILITLMTAALASASAIEGLKIFRLEEGEKVPQKLKPETKYMAIYQSASWCPPCRKITPLLIEEYQLMAKVEQMPVEIILMGADYSEKDMLKYMEDYKMPWPAVEWGGFGPVEKYLAEGIPYLVLIDIETGKVITKGTGPAGIEEAVARMREYSGVSGEEPFKAQGILDKYILFVVVGVSCGFILLLLIWRARRDAKATA